MKVLDLYCGGGGATEGMARAGAVVTGVDINAQPEYPGFYNFLDFSPHSLLLNSIFFTDLRMTKSICIFPLFLVKWED